MYTLMLMIELLIVFKKSCFNKDSIISSFYFIDVEIIVSSGDKEELYPNRFCQVYNEYFKAVLKGKVAIPGLVDFCHSLANHISKFPILKNINTIISC